MIMMANGFRRFTGKQRGFGDARFLKSVNGFRSFPGKQRGLGGARFLKSEITKLAWWKIDVNLATQTK